MNISGNIGKDGLSIMFFESEKEFIANKAPESVQFMEDALISFLRQDEEYKEIGFNEWVDEAEFLAQLEKKKRNSPEYQKWKANYEAGKADQKRRVFWATIVSILLVLLMFWLFYMWFTDHQAITQLSTKQCSFSSNAASKP